MIFGCCFCLVAHASSAQEFVALNQMRGYVGDPNKIQINMRIVIPDWCTKRVNCAPADDCPFINAAVCSPGTCAEETASFLCSCTAPGVESSGVAACGNRYMGDTCPIGCRAIDPCRSVACVNGSCNGGVCTCNARFAAVSATVCADVCNPNPCGSGVCEYGVGSQFTCVCPSGTVLQNKACVPIAACNATTCQGPTSRCQNDACLCDAPFILDVTKQKCVSSPTAAATTTTTTTQAPASSTTTTAANTTSRATKSQSTSMTNSSLALTANSTTAASPPIDAGSSSSTPVGADMVGDSESSGSGSSTTVAIVLGVIAVLCVALVAAFVCWWRAKSRSGEPVEDPTAPVVNMSQRQPAYASARSDRFAASQRDSEYDAIDTAAPQPAAAIHGAGPRIPTDAYGAAPRMPTEVFGYGSTPRMSGQQAPTAPPGNQYEHGVISPPVPPLYKDLILSRDSSTTSQPYNAAPAAGDIAAVRASYDSVPRSNDQLLQQPSPNQYTPAPSKQL